jgi:hypothetical protein
MLPYGTRVLPHNVLLRETYESDDQLSLQRAIVNKIIKSLALGKWKFFLRASVYLFCQTIVPFARIHVLSTISIWHSASAKQSIT